MHACIAKLHAQARELGLRVRQRPGLGRAVAAGLCAAVAAAARAPPGSAPLPYCAPTLPAVALGSKGRRARRCEHKCRRARAPRSAYAVAGRCAGAGQLPGFKLQNRHAGKHSGHLQSRTRIRLRPRWQHARSPPPLYCRRIHVCLAGAYNLEGARRALRELRAQLGGSRLGGRGRGGAALGTRLGGGHAAAALVQRALHARQRLRALRQARLPPARAAPAVTPEPYPDPSTSGVRHSLSLKPLPAIRLTPQPPANYC